MYHMTETGKTFFLSGLITIYFKFSISYLAQIFYSNHICCMSYPSRFT